MAALITTTGIGLSFDSQQDKIDWYSTADGPVREFGELSDSEKIETVGRIDSIRQQLTALAKRYIQATNDPGKLTIGQALLAAAGEPESTHRYLIGNQPTVVFWGFVQSAPDYPELLKKYIQIRQPPVTEPPPARTDNAPPARADIAPHTTDIAPDKADIAPKKADTALEKTGLESQPTARPDRDNSPPEAAATETIPAQEFNLLRYAGKVLWGSAVLAGLLFVIALIVSLFNRSPGIPVPVSTSNQEILDKIRQSVSAGDRLQTELARLQSALAEKKCNCTPPEPPPEPEQATTPAKIEDVVESCNIANLTGRWQSRSNELRNSKSGEPVRVNYDFDGQGEGQIGIIEADGSECKGQASATFKKTGDICVLHVKATPAACPTWPSSYKSHTVECKLGDKGKAKCTLLQKGTRPVYAVFERRSRGQ